MIGIDVNQHAVDTINRGEIHIVEPELDMVVHAAVTEGFLRASTVPEAADAFLIAVPTPFMDDHQPDLSYIESASKAIAPVLKKGDRVIPNPPPRSALPSRWPSGWPSPPGPELPANPRRRLRHPRCPLP